MKKLDEIILEVVYTKDDKCSEKCDYYSKCGGYRNENQMCPKRVRENQKKQETKPTIINQQNNKNMK